MKPLLLIAIGALLTSCASAPDAFDIVFEQEIMKLTSPSNE